MQEYDVQLTLQRALEKYHCLKPRLNTDNGSQFISKNFAEYLKLVGLHPVRTSVAYPHSNGKVEPAYRVGRRYHRTIHEECLATKFLINPDDARNQIAKFIEYYNAKRLYISLFYFTRGYFLNNRITEKLVERNIKLHLANKARYEVKNVC